MEVVMRRRFLFFILILFTSLSLSFSEKPYKLLETETFFEMESVGNPAISPDGKQIIFTRTWVDKMNDRYSSNLWIVDVEGKRIRELTHGNWRDFSPVWSPDGKKIAFLSERDGSTQIHVMWIDTREVAQLTHLERAPSNIVWSPDGKKIAFHIFCP
jgi:Periplasmic component of the Tol biopolymer transport system